MINMNFIMGVTCMNRQHDSIWMIVDKMTKFAHFLSVKTTNLIEDYIKLYIYELIRLQVVLYYG